MTEAQSLPAFELYGPDGGARAFPSGKTALLCFVGGECGACVHALALVEAAIEAFAEALDVLVVCQDETAGALVATRPGLAGRVVDDAELAVSGAYEVAVVPTVVLADGRGRELLRFDGFSRVDWQGLFHRLITKTLTPPPVVEWARFPEMEGGSPSPWAAG